MWATKTCWWSSTLLQLLKCFYKVVSFITEDKLEYFTCKELSTIFLGLYYYILYFSSINVDSLSCLSVFAFSSFLKQILIQSLHRITHWFKNISYWWENFNQMKRFWDSVVKKLVQFNSVIRKQCWTNDFKITRLKILNFIDLWITTALQSWLGESHFIYKNTENQTVKARKRDGAWV